MFRIQFSEFVRKNNPDMKERFREVEAMEFNTKKEAELFITTTFGSGLFYGRQHIAIIDNETSKEVRI